MLIDTQIFIWWMEKNNRLSAKIKFILEDPQEQIFLSLVSIWEIVIKKSIKKLKTPADVEGGIEKSGLEVMPIDLSHVLHLEYLPLHHKDPFDRLLISQAQVEKVTIITADPLFRRYDVKTLIS